MGVDYVKPRKALFPGSFDPFTNGHLDTIERAAKLFDQVIVAILTNTGKNSFFTLDEKIQLTKEATAHLTNVKVIGKSTGLTIHIAEELETNYLIRGIRNVKDYEYERDIAHMNETLDPEIETVFFLAKKEYSFVSSSMIKEIAKFNGNISQYVPENVYCALTKKLQEMR